MTSTMRLGLGCSRFGSLIDGTTIATARRLLEMAAELGILDFDTADIYGQGDSERILGDLLRGNHDVRIYTKAGQRFPLVKRVMIPLKAILRPTITKRSKFRSSIANSRSAPLPRDWSSAHLRRSIERSLRRLGRDYVYGFLLHSPAANVLVDGRAVATLEGLQQEGKAVRIGVSVDDLAAFNAALADCRIEIVQAPASVVGTAEPSLLSATRARGVEIIAREILDGARTPEAVDRALIATQKLDADLALIGTRDPSRLAYAMDCIVGQQRRNV